MSPRSAGFTLMEMLVVLVIAGLLASLLFNSLQSLAIGEARLADRSATTEQQTLARQWWLESTRSLVADRREAFRGGETAFSGLATRDVTGANGQGRLAWRVDGAARQQLAVESSGEMPLVVDPGAANLRFAYLDDEARLHPRWPPAQGVATALPKAVVLLSDDGAETTIAIARIEGAREPRAELSSRELLE